MHEQTATIQTDNTRQILINRACELLAEGGPDAFSVREVARRAGVSIGTLQYHFHTRAILVDACLDRVYAWLEGLGEQLEATSLGLASPVDAACMAVRAGFHFARAHRPFIQLLESTIARSGGIEAHRRLQLRTSILSRGAAWLVTHSTLSEPAAALRIQSLVMLVGRYAILNDENLIDLTGASSLGEAVQAAEAHLEGVTRAVVGIEPS